MNLLDDSTLIKWAGQLDPLKLTKKTFMYVVKRLGSGAICDSCTLNKGSWRLQHENGDHPKRFKCFNTLLDADTFKKLTCAHAIPTISLWCKMIRIDERNFLLRSTPKEKHHLNYEIWNTNCTTKPKSLSHQESTRIARILDKTRTNANANDIGELHRIIYDLRSKLEEAHTYIKKIETAPPKSTFAQMVKKHLPAPQQKVLNTKLAIQAAEQRESLPSKEAAVAKILTGVHPDTNQFLSPRKAVHERMIKDSKAIQNPLLKSAVESLKPLQFKGIAKTRFQLLRQCMLIQGIDLKKVKSMSYIGNRLEILVNQEDAEPFTEAFLKCFATLPPEKRPALVSAETPLKITEDAIETDRNIQNFLTRAAHICKNTTNLAVATYYQSFLPSPELQQELIKRTKQLHPAAGKKAGRTNE